MPRGESLRPPFQIATTNFAFSFAATIYVNLNKIQVDLKRYSAYNFFVHNYFLFKNLFKTLLKPILFSAQLMIGAEGGDSGTISGKLRPHSRRRGGSATTVRKASPWSSNHQPTLTEQKETRDSHGKITGSRNGARFTIRSTHGNRGKHYINRSYFSSRKRPNHSANSRLCHRRSPAR
ncbi:hypothetical protein JMA_27690 [Jeotgalibacillus malaysiensis]|uniref:Uncharacterized protein n=1 Tax=Jeotgalibacillus malaysiensis TaxID=1508404 RepID=A0A0B5APR2_9BACL|nr:hypothetical protein JMA_27690 [Jeotgalibacillus malaysiensis]